MAHNMKMELRETPGEAVLREIPFRIAPVLLPAAWNADVMAGALVAALHQVVILQINVIWPNVEGNDRRSRGP